MCRVRARSCGLVVIGGWWLVGWCVPNLHFIRKYKYKAAANNPPVFAAVVAVVVDVALQPQSRMAG
jgi:hypothetical protein